MTNKTRHEVGARVFLASFPEQDIERAGVFAGTIESDGGSYYCIAGEHSGVWTDESVFEDVLSAANYVRECAAKSVGMMQYQISKRLELMGAMSGLWKAVYDSSDYRKLPGN